MEFLTIGKIVNTRGLIGEVKILSLTDFAPLRYKKGKTVYLELNGEFMALSVVSYHVIGKMDYVRFQGYDTVESVTPWKDAYVYAPKDDIPLKKGMYFYADLVGCAIVNATTSLRVGTVKVVENYNGKNLLRMQLDNDKDVLIPFIEPFVQSVDIVNKIITIQFLDGML
jgi:16S rRNA processing protein RimM